MFFIYNNFNNFNQIRRGKLPQEHPIYIETTTNYFS